MRDNNIYTDAQLATLVAAARALGPTTALRGATNTTPFGLLAATGIRVSEARHLAQGDVDLHGAILHIRATKFRKSRLVPLHPTTASALRSYALRRDRAAQPSPTAAFFVGARGLPLAYSTIRSVFLSLRRALGWEQLTPGRGFTIFATPSRADDDATGMPAASTSHRLSLRLRRTSATRT